MPSAVTYEVYAFINDRWLLDSSFKTDQRQRAIDEAQQLAKRPDIAISKVIRETFDTGRQRMKETTVFRSDRDGSGTTTSISATAIERHDEEAPTIRRLQGATESPQRYAHDRTRTPQRSPARTPNRVVSAGSPLAVLVYKIVLIGVVSFAFASFTTWMVGAA